MGLSVRIEKQLNGFRLSAAWQIGRELAVLFGPSGAGKSLTLRMIAGLMRPDTGAVTLDNRVLFDRGRNIDVSPQSRRVGYVFQDLALFPHMTVRRNILYGAHGIAQRDAEEAAERMMHHFRIDEQRDRYPSEISGGQRQRVAIARALIRMPDILLLDEPFSALDDSLRLDMRLLLGNIQREFDIPVVLVTHDVAEASFLADRIILYDRGSVVQCGPPADVLRNSDEPVCEMLRKSKN